MSIVVFFNTPVIVPTYNHSGSEKVERVEVNKQTGAIRPPYQLLWSFVRIKASPNCEQFLYPKAFADIRKKVSRTVSTKYCHTA